MKWWTESWNPVTGCTKVSEGCKHCYAEAQWPRFRKLYNGREFTDVACHPERLGNPLERKKPTKYFVNSMSDLFHPDVPDDFIDKVFAVIALSPQHTFMICTKRAERMREYFSKIDLRTELVGIEAELLGGIERYDENENPRWPLLLSNVYLGVTAENQETADERIPLLLKTPSAKRFVSAEPLIGPVDLSEHLGMYWNSVMQCYEGTRRTGINCPINGSGRIDLVIAGGESGPKARPSHPDWFRSLRDQCSASGVAFNFKQWGEFGNEPYPNYKTMNAYQSVTIGAEIMFRCGKKRAGRLLDNVEHNGSI